MVLSQNDIAQVMEDVIDLFVIPIFEDNDMNASGEWLRNIHGEATYNKAVIIGLDYSKYLDGGRPPSDKMPPISALEKWAKIKLGLSGQQATSAAFAIAKKIQREGTNYYKQGGTDLINVLNSDEVIDYVEKEVGKLIKVKALDEIKEMI